MTTSGSYAFDPSFAGLFDEACERAGIDPRSTVHDHISSAKMSLNLMLTQWAVYDGDALYRNAEGSQSLGVGVSSFALPAGGWDIIGNDLVLAYNGESTTAPIARMSREDYLFISNKTQTGRPTQFYVDRSVLNTPTVFVWPVPDQVCALSFDYMRTIQTVTSLSETFDVEKLWLDAIASGLALRLAKKFNVNRVPLIEGDAIDSYKLARRAGSGQSQIVFVTRGFGATGRTRRR